MNLSNGAKKLNFILQIRYLVASSLIALGHFSSVE